LVVIPGSKGVGSIGLNGSRVSDFVGNGLAARIGLVNNEWCLLITIVIIIFIEYRPVEKVKVSFMLTGGSAGSNELRRRIPEHLIDEI